MINLNIQKFIKEYVPFSEIKDSIKKKIVLHNIIIFL